MNTAIVGSSGYIAGYILKKFNEMKEIESVLRIDQNSESDAPINLSEAEKFDYHLLDDIDYIVFAAAISGPDQCAQEFDYCWKINVMGTRFFIQEALKRHCKVLFLSSDAVFGDIPGAIYNEESETKAYTAYGRMKKTIEDEFKEEPNFKALRLSYVASARDRFVIYCLDCMKKGTVADVFHPFYRNVIVVSDVIDIIVFFALRWDEYKASFLNAAGRELVSRVRIADELNRFMGGRLKYRIVIPGEEFFKNRPRITQMKSLYMQNYGIISDNTFTEKFVKELEDIRL